MEGLEEIPAKQINYKGVVLKEFDIDKVLERKPQLVLVDELAHTNAAGSRHIKRYQDVEEILRAGIDVYSTVNVQLSVQQAHLRRQCLFALQAVRQDENSPSVVSGFRLLILLPETFRHTMR